MLNINRGKLVLITGGSRGIGSGIVEILLRQGYHVVFTFNKNEKEALILKNRMSEQGFSCNFHQCDISDFASVENFCSLLLQKYGPPYGIVYNAGITLDNLHFNADVNEWKTVIETNLNSVFYFNKHLIPPMLMDGGCIISISSVTAEKGNVGQTCYGASKAALKGLTKSLAKEVGRFNVRVNSVAPGFIKTDMLDSVSENKLSKIRKEIPLGRIGQPSDVGFLVSYLLSKEAAYITGQTIIIDGGLTV